MSRPTSPSTENRNPLSPPRGFCGAQPAPLSKSLLSSTQGDGRGDAPLQTLLAAETSETRPPASPLRPKPPVCKHATLCVWFVIIWVLELLCLVGVILYINLHNNAVAHTLRSHISSEAASGVHEHKVVHFDRARHVLVIVSVVLAVVVLLTSLAACAYWDFFVVQVQRVMDTTFTYFEKTALLRFETMPTCVRDADEMNYVTERVQQFTLIPFSTFDIPRRAQIRMSEASVLLREFRSTLPPELYNEFFSPDEKVDMAGTSSVRIQSDDEGPMQAENSVLSRVHAEASLLQSAHDDSNVPERGSGGDEASLSATNRTANSSSVRFSASATSTTFHREQWRGSQLLRSVTNRQGLELPFSGSRSLENSLSTTQAHNRLLEQVALGLKRRRATVLVVHFSGFQNIASSNSKEAKKLSAYFGQLVIRAARPYECVVAQCRADRIILCWNTFAGRRHKEQKDHELLALRCGQDLSRDIQEALRKEFWRFDTDDAFGMRVVVVGFTASVLAGIVGMGRTVRVIHSNYITLCNELLSLLVYEKSRFAWLDEPPSSLRALGMPLLEGDLDSSTTPTTSHANPWTAIPFDTIDDELGGPHCLYEVSNKYTREVAALHTEGYEAFAQGNYSESLRVFMRLAPENNLSEEAANPIAARLRQLSAYYILRDPTARHQRPFPDWEVVPGDAIDVTHGDAGGAVTTLATAETTVAAAHDSPNGPPAVVSTSRSVRPRRSRRSDVEDLKEEIENATRAKRGESEMTAAHTPRDDVQQGTSTTDPASPTTMTLGSAGPSQEAFSPISSALPPTRTVTVPPTPMDGPCAVVAASSEADLRPTVSVELEDKRHMHFLLSRRRLGETNSSAVFLGLSFTGQQVAVKCIRLILEAADSKPMNNVNRRRAARKGHMPLTNSAIDIDVVTREVQVLSEIRHDHIVGYITSVVSRGQLMIVMEYVSGGSLRDVMRDFKPSIEQSRMYLNQILRGLRHLHRKKIVHCDIKPENVLVSVSGPCKLTDFGISQQISKASSAVRAEGTPCYMAPEAADGKAVRESDIWSFGIMMVELLTGSRPWARELHPLAMRAQLRRGAIQPEIQGEVSDEVRHIFAMCTQREPLERPSADDLLAMTFFTPKPRRNSKGPSQPADNGPTHENHDAPPAVAYAEL